MTPSALVTGVNGFIGRHLVERLRSDGWTINGIVHRHRDRALKFISPEHLHLPPRSTNEAIELLDRLKPGGIFHLAATAASELPADIDAMLATNIGLGFHLLEAASRLTTKPCFISAGSFWEYSDSGSYSPNTLYAATKHCLHDILVYYRERHGMRAVSLVLFDTYGTDDERNKLWGQLLTAAPGTRIDLTPGEQLVDLVHISDVVSAFISAAELLSIHQLPESAYAVRSPARDTLRSIAEEICRASGKELHLNWGAKPYRPIEIFNPWSGPLLPGWSARKTIEAGITELTSSAT